MKGFYFFENWADYAKSVDDAERLRFFDTFLKVCFDDYTPSPSAGNEYMYYCLIRPAVEERLARYALSESGVKARQEKRATAKTGAKSGANKGVRNGDAVKRSVATAVATAVPTKTVSCSTAVATGEQPIKEKEKENIKRERDKAHAHTPDSASEGSADGDPAEAAPDSVAGFAVGPNGLPVVRPSLADVREAARRLGCDAAFAEYFHAEMEKLGWQSRDRGGRMFAVDRRNVTSILRGWWEAEKKSSAARVADGGADGAARLPETGWGRRALPSFTGNVDEEIEA